MQCSNEFFEKHKTTKTRLKVYLSNGTMLEGAISSYGEQTFILDKCLVFKDKVISITPK